MTNRIASVFRNFLNTAYKIVVRNGKNQKKLVVFLYNCKALFDRKKTVSCNIFDYEAIINGKQQFKTGEYYRGNSFYGIASSLRKYSGYDHPINACIEHGVYFGDYVDQKEAVKSGLNAVITFGKSRIEVLEKTADVPVVPVGPYIKYADLELSDKEMSSIKQKLGKVLLVFPDHSMDRVESVFNSSVFIDSILTVKEKLNIDTVLVCLYWKDIVLKRDEEYKKCNFTVVTSGYQSDPHFLKRLKTYIELCDYSISNAVGTHVGYCISLNKPHCIISQNISYKGDSEADLQGVTENFNNLANVQKKEVLEAFSELELEITEKQRQIVNRYWGTEFFREKNDLYDILKSLEGK